MKWLKLNVVQVSKIFCFLKTVWTIMSNTLKGFQGKSHPLHYQTTDYPNVHPYNSPQLRLTFQGCSASCTALLLQGMNELSIHLNHVFIIHFPITEHPPNVQYYIQYPKILPLILCGCTLKKHPEDLLHLFSKIIFYK